MIAKLGRQIEHIKFLGLISCIHLAKRSYNLEKLGKLSPHIKAVQSDLLIHDYSHYHHPACLMELL